MSEAESVSERVQRLASNAVAAWRYAFSKQQSAAWDRLRNLAQITDDPTDVELLHFGLSVAVDAETSASLLAGQMADAAEQLAAGPAAFVVAALLGQPDPLPEFMRDAPLLDEDFQPLVREGEVAGDDLLDQVVRLADGDRLDRSPAFELTLLECVRRATRNAEVFDVPVTGATLVAHPALEQAARAAFMPRYGDVHFVTPFGDRRLVDLWFTPAIPHPDLAFLVPHVPPDKRAFEIVQVSPPSAEWTPEQFGRPARTVRVGASLGLRVHRAPWVIKITSDDAEDAGGALCR